MSSGPPCGAASVFRHANARRRAAMRTARVFHRVLSTRRLRLRSLGRKRWGTMPVTQGLLRGPSAYVLTWAEVRSAFATGGWYLFLLLLMGLKVPGSWFTTTLVLIGLLPVAS